MSSHLTVVKSNDTPPTEMINGRVLTTDDLAILTQINKKFAHVVIAGTHKIVSKEDCSINGSKIVYGAIDSFQHYFTNKSDVAGLNRGKAWAKWGNKAFFDNGIGFYPNLSKLPNGCYNLFDGWHCKPKKGDCSFVINHINEVLCDGNLQAGGYFIQWLAHIFQRPDVKPSVAVFIKSVEGTGKGTLFRLLQEILGVHTSQINGAELVTRNFNGILTAKLLIFADEVNLIERDTFDKVKGLISEPTCQLEKKGIEAEPMANLSRFIFASNHDQVIPAGKRERRFLLIEASDKKASDKDYWVAFNKLINPEYAGYFLDYLLKVDLSGFDPYNAPMTKELIKQKTMNFEPIDLYICEQLNEVEPFGGEKRTPSTDLMNRYLQWLKDNHYTDDMNQLIKPNKARAQLALRLIKLGFIKIGDRADRKGGIFYQIPNIPTLRETFANDHALTAQDLFVI
jgi:putative DNA primase/helicase